MAQGKEQKKKYSREFTRPTAYNCLLEFLEEKQMTVKTFSELYGFNQFTVSKWANNHRRPRLDMAQRLEKLTGGRVKAIDWDQ